MGSLAVCLSRGHRLLPLSAHLSRLVQGGKQASRPGSSGCSQISCHRAGSSLHLRPAPSPLRLHSNGPTLCLQVRPRPPSPLQPGPVPSWGGQQLHTSAPRRALPAPLLWLVLKPLQKILAIILGRSIRKWWVSLPSNRRQLLHEWVRRRRWHLAGGAGVAMVIAALLLLTHLDESPVTGRTRLLVFSRENYMELAALTSEAYMEEFADLLLPVTDPRHKVVERVVQHLAQRNKDIPEVSDVTWTVHIVQSPNVNAFVLPNGKVFMFTGMLDTVVDVHQLTIVLGHEMAHALLGHSLMFSRPYSRKLEAEADKVGLQLAAKACADVRAGPVFWQQMEIRDQLTGEPTFPEWLSTHPSHRNRFTLMDSLIPEALELRESCVCPALPESDPRVVFAKSVQVLLKNAKDRERGPEGASKTHLPHSPASLSPALPAALLPQTAPLPSPSVGQQSKGPVPAVASEIVAAPVPAQDRTQDGLQIS
ncbi:metalloendopeptidase OMA1, mitochondrial isoform X2 [Limanda limanda]|uniref:metalloendopeptidase OMA1, mitochondrial isoform X2 n=1 Tax=Limanda limanda TaxID=27771 RepID=UPI0029C7D8A3|nr:metalloendopeptidase OMA1, mitochondrial isoform X2 [Limanda limanda]